MTLAVFLRTDIFLRIIASAPEPDKLPVSLLNWPDAEALLSVVDRRFAASRRHGTQSQSLWDTYFPAAIGDKSIREYLHWRCLPRPRDIVFFCKEAIANAINRDHKILNVEDVLLAEQSYSYFAFRSVLLRGQRSCRISKLCCSSLLVQTL